MSVLMEVGVTKSREHSRVPPMEKWIWRAVCTAIFEDTAHLILCTDGAPCYQLAYPAESAGVVEHYRVNHEEREWTRPEPCVLWNSKTGEVRFALVGTQYLDSTWHRVKSFMPKGLSVKHTGQR